MNEATPILPDVACRLAFSAWQKGQRVDAGRLLFERVPERLRPKWAADILRLVLTRSQICCEPIETILDIADNEARWGEAHDAFSTARRALLQLQARPLTRNEELLRFHLSLAELVAKVTYNATNPIDEFDEDSGWWIAGSVIQVLGNDAELATGAWNALMSIPTA